MSDAKEIRLRIESIKANVAEGQAGGWDAKGYTKAQRVRCKKDAAHRIQDLKAEGRKLRRRG